MFDGSVLAEHARSLFSAGFLLPDSRACSLTNPPPFDGAVLAAGQVNAKHDQLSPRVSGGGRARYGLRAGGVVCKGAKFTIV